MHKRIKYSRLACLALVGLTVVTLLSGCGQKRDFAKLNLTDGEYMGHYEDESDDSSKSSVDVKIVVQAGKIVACESVEKEGDGKVKDEHYGENAGDANFVLAQKALAGIQAYPDKLLEAQDPEKVDAISGATISLKRFKEAVWDALNQAANQGK